MGTILKFPDRAGVRPELRLPNGIPVQPMAQPIAKPKVRATGIPKSVVTWLIDAVWTLMLILWPFLRWIIGIDVFIQAVRMAIYWDEPGTYAGWTFAFHFLAFAALTYFVVNYKTKKK